MKQLVTEEDNYHLLRYVTDDEIKESLFQMDPYKAPGPNDF